MRDEPIKVLVADDHEIVRVGVAALLARAPDIQVVGAVASGTEALALLEHQPADVVILDHRMPGVTGIATCDAITRRWPGTGVLILSAGIVPELVDAAVVAGARGFLSKKVVPADLTSAVRAIANGQTVFDPVAGANAGALRSSRRRLVPNEIEILEKLAQGLSNRQIAKLSYHSEATVKLQMRELMRKIGVTRRWEAVSFGIQRGII